jgi:hypothetical protein
MNRKVSEATVHFLEGFLSQKMKDGFVPDYGYGENHVPKTDHEEAEMPSCFDLISDSSDSQN